MFFIVPGKAEFLLIFYEMILPVMYLEILVVSAMHAAAHIAVKYFSSLSFPVGMQ